MLKVGEYWYIGYICDVNIKVTYLSKILAVSSNMIVVSFDDCWNITRTKTLDFNTLTSAIKWQPTLFWRLLGYK